MIMVSFIIISPLKLIVSLIQLGLCVVTSILGSVLLKYFTLLVSIFDCQLLAIDWMLNIESYFINSSDEIISKYPLIISSIVLFNVEMNRLSLRFLSK